MNRVTIVILAAVFVGAAMLFANPLFAQAPEKSAGEQVAATSGGAKAELTLAEVESALAALEANSEIDNAAKTVLQRKYKQAIETMKEAAGFSANAAAYRESIQTAPLAAAKHEEELKSLPSIESAAAITASGSIEDLKRDVDSRRAALAALREDLSKTTAELGRLKSRPAEISKRLPEAQQQLNEIQEKLAAVKPAEDAKSSSQVADYILLRAGRSRLLSELEMLKQGQLSLSAREGLLQIQQKLLKRQVENAAATLNNLETLLQQRLAKEVSHISSLADSLPQDLPENDKEAHALAVEVQALAKDFEDVVESLQNVKTAQDDITSRLAELTAEFETICEQAESGGGGNALVQLFIDLQSHALNARVDVHTEQLPKLEETRLASLEVKYKLRGQPTVEKQFADHSLDAVARLVTARGEVLEKLQTQYGNLIRALAVLNGDKRQYLDKAEDVRDYIWKQLFGLKLKSCPTISAKSFSNIPLGLRWAFEADHCWELWRALRATAENMPVRSLGLVLVVVVLLVMRPWIGKALQRSGERIRRISTDRYSHTIKALLWTILLALPIPLLFGFFGWALELVPAPGAWMRGIADGLQVGAKIIFATEFLAAVCRPGGLGVAHFGWSKASLARYSRAVRCFTVVYIPAFLLAISCAYGEAAEYFESVGRISFMLALVWGAILIWRLFQGTDGILATLTREQPGSFITRQRYLWFVLLLGVPLVLLVLASLGYLITVIEVSLGLFATVVLLVGGSVLYGLVLRLFAMKHRKLALAEAIERRRARQEAADSEEEQAGEIVSVDPQDEEELDLDSISEQTYAMLRLLFSLGVAIAIVAYWSKMFSLIAVIDSIVIPLTGGLTLLDLIQVALIGAVTYFTVQNLPGLLELAVLRTTKIEAGTRHAITTLCQYAVIALGLFVLCNVLQVDWAKFGWMAAALSVGLGFGLQEVVANFVCGLILLFERPIRVGDVVTVENMTGTVTKIHLRATTITNWDRQEFLVPNKTLITSPILNWTLSEPLNRIVIPVGVAYGSDTEKARQILLDVAAEHPRILDDPVPIASFEQFADSSLNLLLRAYLPDLDNRIGIISELHTEIDKRFAAAGIEIAFPQRDIHIRSGCNTTR